MKLFKTTGKFGEVAIELKLLDHDQMQELLAEQKKVNLDPGEILVLKGRLSVEQLKKERRAFKRGKKD